MVSFSIQKPRAKRSINYHLNTNAMVDVLAEKVKEGMGVDEFNALDFEKQLTLLKYAKDDADVRGAAEILTEGLLVSTRGSSTNNSSCGFGSRSYTTVFGSVFYVGARGLFLHATIETPVTISRHGDDVNVRPSEHRILDLHAAIDDGGKHVHYKGPLVGHLFVETYTGPVLMNSSSSNEGRVPLTDYNLGPSRYYGANNHFQIRPKIEEQVRKALESIRR